jgi:hypothetical protein
MDDIKPHEHRVTEELAEGSSTSATEQNSGDSKERYEVRTEYEARLLEREVGAFNHIDSDDIGRTLGVISMRALGIRSSYKGRTVDA